jgi:hypothetical protein
VQGHFKLVLRTHPPDHNRHSTKLYNCCSSSEEVSDAIVPFKWVFAGKHPGAPAPAISKTPWLGDIRVYRVTFHSTTCILKDLILHSNILHVLIKLKRSAYVSSGGIASFTPLQLPAAVLDNFPLRFEPESKFRFELLNYHSYSWIRVGVKVLWSLTMSLHFTRQTFKPYIGWECLPKIPQTVEQNPIFVVIILSMFVSCVDVYEITWRSNLSSHPASYSTPLSIFYWNSF